jgi:mono/diheme cytochrome c family protein
MTKLLVLLSALTLLPFAPSARPAQDAAQAPPAATTPPDTKNPVKPTAESQAKAKKMYTYDCEMCHNANGDGKSDLAKDMSLTLTDLSDPKTLADKSDAALFDLIRNGKGKMPPEDAARAKPEDVWNLIIYVRGMAKK